MISKLINRYRNYIFIALFASLIAAGIPVTYATEDACFWRSTPHVDTINQDLIGFSMSATEVTTQDVVHFRSNDAPALSKQTWDFGDGETSTEKYPEHAYAHAGAYRVRLTTDPLFGAKSSVTKTVWVSEVI